MRTSASIFSTARTRRSRARWAQRLLEALGASKFDHRGGAVKSDPASLADEAGAMSLFGGKRASVDRAGGEDIVAGVEALLDAAQPKARSSRSPARCARPRRCSKLAEASPSALAFAAYAPEGQDAERMVLDVGRSVRTEDQPTGRGPDRRRSCGNDQAIVAQELQKLALYLDASPHSPKELDHDAVDAVGADTAEGDFLRLADLALSGRHGRARRRAGAAARRRVGGDSGRPLASAAAVMLAPARARVERGESADAVMTSLGKALFWKDKGIVGRMLSQWDAERLAEVAERAGRARAEPDVQSRAAAGGAGRRAARDRARGAPALKPRSARRSGAGRSCRADRGSNNAA